MESLGINTNSLVYYMQGDMDGDNACPCLLSFDKNSVYFLSAEEHVLPVKGVKKLSATFIKKNFRVFPYDSICELKLLRRISTAAIVAETSEGEPFELLTASLACIKYMEAFVRVFNDCKTGKITGEKHALPECCPKCGRPYPEQGVKTCPNCVSRFSVTGRLLTFFSNYRGKVAVIILAMLLTSAFNLLNPYVSSSLLYDDVLVESGRWFGLVGRIVLIIFSVRVGALLMGILYSYIMASIMPWITYDLKVRIFSAMQRLSTGYYTSKQTGTLMTRVNRDAEHIYWFFVDGVPYVVVNALLLTGVAVVMFMMNWKLALVAIAVIPLVLFGFRFLWSSFRSLHHRIWVSESRLYSLVSDVLGGQRIIKAFARENAELSRFDNRSTSLGSAEIRIEDVANTAFPLIYLLMFAAQVVITAIGGIMVLKGELTLGTLISFINYIGLLYGPLEYMSNVTSWWSRCVDSAQRVFEIIDARPDVLESDHPVKLERIKGSVELDHVTFSYEPARPVIRNMSLSVPAGQMLGIVGKAGAGKSTMANLMARLYDPSGGTIRVDGVDVRDLPMELLRKSIGIVSQEIYLFIGTVADNIRYADPSISIDKVISAAKAAGAHDFIMRLPDGYETRVGAGGQDLSGGERQRLSIARVILQDPRILILDEATAAMDTETERRIQESINKLKSGRTTIAIAHRLSTLRDADMIAVVDKGQVTEYGTHDELIHKKGEFFKLYSIQTEALKYTGIGV